jgi:hypothetical protein
VETFWLLSSQSSTSKAENKQQTINSSAGRREILRRFLFYKTSIPALGSNQFPIQWKLDDPSPGTERLGHEVNHSPPCNTEVKNEWTSLNKNRLHENTEASEILLLTLMKHVHTFEINSSSSYCRYVTTVQERDFIDSPTYPYRLQPLTKLNSFWLQSEVFGHLHIKIRPFLLACSPVWPHDEKHELVLCGVGGSNQNPPPIHLSKTSLCPHSFSTYTLMLFSQHTFHNHTE